MLSNEKIYFFKKVFHFLLQKSTIFLIFLLRFAYILALGETMNYVKKMCILRQIKHGFSGDGKPLSGLIKAEQYGKNLAIEVSVINFAPLVSGDYYCLLSDGKGKTEMLTLRGKSIFNILSDLDISGGFCAVVCYVKNEVVPIAYGINGNGAYDWRAILNAALPPVFPTKQQTPLPAELAETDVSTLENNENDGGRYALNNENTPTIKEPSSTSQENKYNDERVATDNYYEVKDEQELSEKAIDDASTKSAVEKQGTQAGHDAKKDVDAEDVLHPFTTKSDGYYEAVKSEIEDLFKQYPRDKTLQNAFSCSDWVRVKGEKHTPEYLVGVLYEDGKASYICYALRAEDKDTPPSEIKDVCTFVPVSAFVDAEGFFVIFQSAATGECVKPTKL